MKCEISRGQPYLWWLVFLSLSGKQILLGDNRVTVLRMASVTSGGKLPSHGSVLKSNVPILAKYLVTELKKPWGQQDIR